MWTSVSYGQGGEVLPRLYDNHPAKTGSFHQVYDMTGTLIDRSTSRLYSVIEYSCLQGHVQTIAVAHLTLPGLGTISSHGLVHMVKPSLYVD